MYMKGDPGVNPSGSAQALPATSPSETLLHPNGTTAGIFDGFDIDWEYPGNNNNPADAYSSADTENLVLLMKEFRTQLNALSRSTGKRYTLSVELPAGLQNVVDEDPAGVARYANYDVIMDYDFQGPWDGTGPTNFESNLYESPAAPNTTAEPLISLSSTVKYYEGRGVRSRQLVVGLPYYGHGWTGVPASSDLGSTNQPPAQPPRQT